MIITNLTNVDYWFGPMHLPAGSGTSQLNLDDTSDTSLYLLNDEVADAVNTLYLSSQITVSSAASPFPRPTGTPSLLHGDGSPEGLVYAPQGSLYMRRDSSQATTGLYTKTTGVTQNTGWATVLGPAPGDLKPSGVSSAPGGWLLCDGHLYATATYPSLFGAIGYAYGGSGANFNVPDLRGRVPIGAGTGTATGASTWALGNQPTSFAGGEETHLLGAGEIPGHTHGYSGTTGDDSPDHSHNFANQPQNYWGADIGSGTIWQNWLYNWATGTTGGANSNHQHAFSGTTDAGTGGGGAHNNVQPVSVVNWFIKT